MSPLDMLAVGLNGCAKPAPDDLAYIAAAELLDALDRHGFRIVEKEFDKKTFKEEQWLAYLRGLPGK